MTSEVPQPAQVYLQLRDHILSLTPAEVGLQPTPALPHVWCVMMETGYPVGWATLIALADGTTSLNFSTGGGMLGSGDYKPVAEASRAFAVETELILDQMSLASEFPLPEAGEVRFNILTYEGRLSSLALEEELAAGQHPFSSLYTKARETLEQLRLLAEMKRGVHQQEK